MVFGQLHYTKRVVFMPFLVAEILNFQGSAHHVGVGSLSYLIEKAPEYKDMEKFTKEFVLVSNAFVDCRYAFEGVVPSFDFRFLAALANASIRGLLAHYDVKLVAMEEKPMTDEELDKVMEDNRQQFIEKNISYIAKKEKGSLS